MGPENNDSETFNDFKAAKRRAETTHALLCKEHARKLAAKRALAKEINEIIAMLQDSPNLPGTTRRVEEMRLSDLEFDYKRAIDDAQEALLAKDVARQKRDEAAEELSHFVGEQWTRGAVKRAKELTDDGQKLTLALAGGALAGAISMLSVIGIDRRSLIVAGALALAAIVAMLVGHGPRLVATLCDARDYVKGAVVTNSRMIRFERWFLGAELAAWLIASLASAVAWALLAKAAVGAA